jgi:hypothetical protein
MRRKREIPIGDRTEREIHAWLRTRDAGPAPDRLRLRIAHLTDEAERTPRLSPWTLFRPAIALSGVAAAAVLLLAAVVLRGRVGPVGGPGGSPLPTILPTPLPSGLTPWPGTGAVLAVPVDGPLLVALVCAPFLAAMLLLGLMVRGSFADARRSVAREMSWRGLRQLRTPRAWLLRVLGTVLAAALIVAGFNMFAFDQNVPLRYGSVFEAGGAAALGYRSATGGGADESYVRFVPGGQVELGIALANPGDQALTVTSFDTERFLTEQPAGAFISSVELRLPPGTPTFGCSAYSADSPSGDICTEAFHPFELPPGGETSLALILHFKNCALVAPGPTPVPSAEYQADYLPTTGYATFIDLPFRFSMQGIERETDVRMHQAVGLVFGSSSVTC